MNGYQCYICYKGKFTPSKYTYHARPQPDRQ